MATKSFLKNITIKKRMPAGKFLNALEHAENKTAKCTKIDKRVEYIEDNKIIRNIFNI